MQQILFIFERLGIEIRRRRGVKYAKTAMWSRLFAAKEMKKNHIFPHLFIYVFIFFDNPSASVEV